MSNRSSPSSSSSDLPSDPEAVARSYFDAFATSDPDRIAAHVSDDFSNEHTAALGSGCTGRSAYLERLPGFLSDMADLRYDIEHLVASGSSVAVFYTMTARWQGRTPIEIHGAQRLEIVDGAITRRVDYWDSKVFLDQLDAAASEPAPARGSARPQESS